MFIFNNVFSICKWVIMEDDRIKKAFRTIEHIATAPEGGTDFLVVVGRLLKEIEKPNMFKTRQ